MMGYFLLPVFYFLGFIHIEFAILFFLLALGYGVLLSQLAVGLETLLLQRYPRVWDRILLFLLAFLEALGYRQVLAWERFWATFQVLRKRGQWGEMRRKGLDG